MPIKGTAFEKPGVNAAHKAAVREQARLRAAAHETADDDLLNDLQAYIAASALSASRKAEAVRGLEKAVVPLFQMPQRGLACSREGQEVQRPATRCWSDCDMLVRGRGACRCEVQM